MGIRRLASLGQESAPARALGSGSASLRSFAFPFASLPRDELGRRILRRADAWNFRGKRAKWVEELVASLEAS